MKRRNDKAIASTIRQMLDERGPGKTICPSEVARAVGGNKRDDWEPLMEPVREVAAQMTREGTLVITQRGEPVDASTAKGPIRLRLR
jgi:hypothetical protein